MTEKPAVETMTNQERFNSAVMGWISEATEAIEGCGAVSDSAKRYVDEMRCQCGDAYQALFHQESAPARLALTEAERDAIERQLGWIKRMLVAWADRGPANDCLRCDEAALTALLERTKPGCSEVDA
jgi:hypothetical protein